MPNIKSAKKRVLVIQKKTLENQIIKSSLKTAIKKFEALALENNKEAATEAFKLAVKKIDKAVAKGVLHKNNAARKKASLAIKYNRIGA